MNNIHLHIIGSKSFSDLLNELDFNYSITSDKNLKYNNKDFLVRIIFVEKLQLAEIKKFFLENIPTIFFLNNKDFLIKNKLTLLDFHVSLLTPIEILSFREILNILLTKYNFFKKSKIIINDYEIDSNQRVITKNKIKAKLTEKELELILVLNKNNGLEKSFLLKNIWNRSSDLESHAFETHLHRLRKKINKFFKDSKFIIEKNSLYYLSK
ncbi:MAG: response regulator transcription factor [Candidatus Fonsibacter sp.]|nr:response regulator transcription factor [Candidatus Fonsibacter sp.]